LNKTKKNTNMKRAYILLTLILFSISLSAQINSDTLIIKKDYERTTKSPQIADSGTVIINLSDTLYLVNSLRYQYYEELRGLVRDSIGQDIEKIVLKYEKIITENDFLFFQLEEQCREQSKLYERSIKDMKTSLTEIERNLDLTQRSLENANKSIELGLKQISESQKKKIWQNIGIFGGGVSIGLVACLLFVN